MNYIHFKLAPDNQIGRVSYMDEGLSKLNTVHHSVGHQPYPSIASRVTREQAQEFERELRSFFPLLCVFDEIITTTIQEEQRKAKGNVL